MQSVRQHQRDSVGECQYPVVHRHRPRGTIALRETEGALHVEQRENPIKETRAHRNIFQRQGISVSTSTWR